MTYSANLSSLNPTEITDINFTTCSKNLDYSKHVANIVLKDGTTRELKIIAAPKIWVLQLFHYHLVNGGTTAKAEKVAVSEYKLKNYISSWENRGDFDRVFQEIVQLNFHSLKGL